MLGVVIDCEDPARLAGFWSSLVGGEIDARSASADWVALVDVAGLGYLGFQRVLEPKSVKNRLHLDHIVDKLDAAVEHAVELGASTIGPECEEPTNRFQVMHDPEGNEFCLVQLLR
ncbi:MAG: VOC family protein [Acidimicrobiia bacterium]